jgi:rhodanese-related sulfurtransferase
VLSKKLIASATLWLQLQLHEWKLHVVADATIVWENVRKVKNQMKTINGQELRKQLEAGKNLVVVEALPEEYYRSGHIPGAAHLPLENVDRRAATVIPDRQSPVVVYCASETCENSYIAAKRLAELGYENVSVYPGGKADWKQLGHPLEKAA